MPTFYSHEKSSTALYHFMVSAIVPRPIGFISTCSQLGVPNLAPYSFFNGICASPPTVCFSVLDRPDYGMKDTSANLQTNPEFVAHIVSQSIAEAMNTCCGDFGPEINEFVESGLHAADSTVVSVPRVAEAPIALECRLTHHLRLGTKERPVSHIIGEVVYWHIAEGILDKENRIDPSLLNAIGRMGGTDYTKTQDRFHLDRPNIPVGSTKGLPTL